MANDNFPQGLKPLTWPQGTVAIHYYRAQTGVDIFLGQPVDLDSTGYVTNAIPVGTAGIVQALGVAVGFADTDKAGTPTDDPFLDVSDLTPKTGGRLPGDVYVAVADDPEQIYVIQGDTGGTLVGLAGIGESAALIYRATSGNTDTGWANLELDASSNAASTGQLVRIVGLHETVNSDATRNTAGANYAKWLVKILTHRMNQVNLTSVI